MIKAQVGSRNAVMLEVRRNVFVMGEVLYRTDGNWLGMS
jgi:hypothetical protein